VDWTYDKAIAKPSEALASFAASVIDVKVIDGAVNGVAGVFRRSGSALRKVQSGYVRSYALGLFGGAVLIVAYVLIRARG
jgi:NADH-quinone oxidoreductase subunit L